MSTSRIALWLAVFMPLVVVAVQCQQGGSPPTVPTPPAAVAKNGEKKTKPRALPKNNTGSGIPQSDLAKENLARPLANYRIDALAYDYSNVSLTPCGQNLPEVGQLKCEDKGFQAKVTNEDAKSQLKKLRVGDMIRAEINNNGELQFNLARDQGNYRLDVIASDYANASLSPCDLYNSDTHELNCSEAKRFQAKVTDQAIRSQLKQLQVGDVVRVEVNRNGELQDLRGPLSVPDTPIPPAQRFLVLAVCALLILGLAAAVSKGHPLKFIISEDHRYSNSRFQIALWFWVVMSTYLAVVVFRVCYAGWDFLGGVSIPQNLLVLSGLSAITYGGAKAITTSKINAATNPPTVAIAAPAAPPAPVSVAVTPTPGSAPVALAVTHTTTPTPTVVTVTPAANLDPKNANGRLPGHESLFKDLVQNDYGDFDFGDFQMIVVTLVAVAMYISLIFHFLHSIEFLKTAALPDLDTTILAGFGLGQGAYLAKKAGGDVGKA